MTRRGRSSPESAARLTSKSFRAWIGCRISRVVDPRAGMRARLMKTVSPGSEECSPPQPTRECSETTGLYTPELTSAIRTAMAGYEEQWIGEFECYSLPGRKEGMMTVMLYHRGDFIFTRDDEVGEFLPALGLAEHKTG